MNTGELLEKYFDVAFAKTRRDAVRDGSVQTIAGDDALAQIKFTVVEKLDIGKTEKSNSLVLH
ncbi:MAG: hypothetical protein WCP16_19150 [Pseudanabaena sp. ELA645]|jgi:hypothetical protein